MANPRVIVGGVIVECGANLCKEKSHLPKQWNPKSVPWALQEQLTYNDVRFGPWAPGPGTEGKACPSSSPNRARLSPSLMASPARYLWYIHLAVLLFGLAGLFGKLLALPPVVIVLGRVVFASVALLLASVIGRLPLLPARRHLLAFVGLGILLAAHWTTFFESVQVSSVAVALITFSTFPVFVAFLEPIFFRERLHLADVLLAVVALIGVVILLPGLDLGDSMVQGVGWGVASGFTFALLALLNRKYVRQHAGITIALYQDAVAALVLLPVAFLQQPTITGKDILLLLILGVVCTAVAHSLFISGLRRIKARTASMIACLEPVYGTLLAAFLLGEVPSLRTLLGGAIVLGGAFYATVRSGSEEPAPDPPLAEKGLVRP